MRLAQAGNTTGITNFEYSNCGTEARHSWTRSLCITAALNERKLRSGATNRVTTEQRSCSIPVALGAQVIFRKVHRSSFRKMSRFQAITNSVLKPRSTELLEKNARRERI